MKKYRMYKILSLVTLGKLHKKYKRKYREEKNSFILQREEKHKNQLKEAQIFAIKQYNRKQREENNNKIILIDENGNENLSDYVEELNISFCGKNSTVKINFNSKFNNAKIIIFDNSLLSIGKNFSNNPPLTIYCCTPNQLITIGNDCMFSWDVTIHNTDHHAITSETNIINTSSSLTIGNHVWIGQNATILKNSYIPDNSIIAAGAIYTSSSFKEKDVSTNTQNKGYIFAGNPAKCVKTGDFTWHRENCQKLMEEHPEFK